MRVAKVTLVMNLVNLLLIIINKYLIKYPWFLYPTQFPIHF